MSRKKVRVAIVGVGNCASALVQGVDYYSEGSQGGVITPSIGGYAARDIEFSAAFDVVTGKVGQALSDAIFTHPNNAEKFYDGDLACARGVKVQRGMTHDGIGKYLAGVVEKSPEPTVDVAEVLRETKTDVLVNYLPVGSEAATKWYMEQALAAEVAVVNCIPVFIASSPFWAERFRSAGVPIIGDDIKSQVGATILHRALVRLWEDRGFRLSRTYQLNVGGNMDFLNMLERERLESKKISKTQAVTSQLGTPLPPGYVHVGPSDYVPWLGDRKKCFIRMEGTGFGGVPMELELQLTVHDSPNSAGVVMDAVRCAKVARDRGWAGPLVAPSAWYMKSPGQQIPDDEALEMLRAEYGA